MGNVVRFDSRNRRFVIEALAQRSRFRVPVPRKRRSGIALSSSYGLIALAIFSAVVAWQFMFVGTGARIVASAERSFSICGSGSRINCVVDGDTFYFSGEKVRIADINTPEISQPLCQREKMLGDKAKTRLHALLNAGPVELRAGPRERDVYGRLLRTVYRDGRSLGDILIAEGLAHRWKGFKQNWC